MESGDQSCTECDEEGVAWFRVVGLVVAMLLVIAAVAAAYSCYQIIAARGAKKEAGELRWVKPNFISGGAVRRASPHEQPFGKLLSVHFARCP
jgi:hypothetical protein